MKHWNVLRQIVGIALVVFVMVGCGKGNGSVSLSTPTNKPLIPTRAILTPTPTPTSTPTPAPTPTPVPIPTGPTGTPVPGQWQADGNELGPFEFTVSSDSTTITKIAFHIANLKCGFTTMDADATVSGSWAVSNGQFTLDAVPNPILDVVIIGTFDQTGRHATGTWKAVVFGQTCPGTWIGNSTG